MATVYAIFLCAMWHGQIQGCHIEAPAFCELMTSDGCEEWVPYRSMAQCRRDIPWWNGKGKLDSQGRLLIAAGPDEQRIYAMCLEKQVQAWQP